MSGIFSPSKTTTTSSSSVKLAPQQEAILNAAQPYVNKFATNGITLPTGSQIAGFNPTQLQAQQQVLTNAPKQQAGADTGLASSNWLLSGAALDPNSNPGLRGAIDAATRPLFENLTQTILPSIRGEAAGSGNIGSSRQGIAEGLATQGTQRAASDAASNIAFSGYNAGLDSMNRALGSLGSTLDAQNSSALGIGAVGDVNQQQQQMVLDEATQKYMQGQLLPLEIGKELVNLVGAIPSAGATNSTVAPGNSLFQNLLGAGMTAAGLGWSPFS